MQIFLFSVRDSPHKMVLQKQQRERGMQFLNVRSVEGNESYGGFKKLLPPCILFSKQVKDLSD